MSDFDWQDYIELADELVDGPLDVSAEAQWRAAASRAYYGAFCMARNALESEAHTFPETGRAHRDVRRTLQKDPDRKKLGETLNRLHERRKAADYDDRLPLQFRKKAKMCVTNAREIVVGLSEGDS
jgi:uncharacterized protein (UPF0332 family)